MLKVVAFMKQVAVAAKVNDVFVDLDSQIAAALQCGNF